MASTYCKHFKRVAWASIGPREALFTRLRCKQWTCEYCSEKNASIWRAHLNKRLPEVSDVWWLVTITAHEHRRSEALSLENIRVNLEKMFKRIKRIWPDLQYVRVYEKHPTSDAIHAHLIVAGLTPFVLRGLSKKNKTVFTALTERTKRNGTWTVKTWFKKTARELNMGYMIDVQRIADTPSKAVWYVTKYLTKAQQAFHIAFLRHVQVSRGIGSPKNETEETWQSGSYITVYTFPAGTKITDLNTGSVIDNNFWEVHGFYPNED